MKKNGISTKIIHKKQKLLRKLYILQVLGLIKLKKYKII